MTTITGVTGAVFDALPYEAGRKWELLSGELVEVSSPTPNHQDVVFNLLLALKQYVKLHRKARTHQDVEFALSQIDRLRPDICVLLDERADLDGAKVSVQGAPDIAVEVISQSERAGDARRKVQIYLETGVQEVWQLYPVTRQMLIHSLGGRRELQGSGILTSELLPGFECPVAIVFD